MSTQHSPSETDDTTDEQSTAVDSKQAQQMTSTNNEPDGTVADTGDTAQYGQRQERINRVDPTETVVNALSEISDRFLVSDPPETVGGNINDTRDVKDCINAAAEYFHAQLPDRLRTHITQKWGITDSMIDAKKIGYVDGSNDVISFLRETGFDPLTIIRAGLGTETTIKHLFECGGVSSENEHLVPPGRREYEVDDECSHTVDSTLEILMRAQVQGLITPEEIDLEAVVNYLDSNNELSIWSWWDNRITFPYRNENGEIQYFIVRATDESDDIIYNNGVVDRTGKKCLPLPETRLGQEIVDSDDDWTARANEYVVLPHRTGPYKTPDEDEHKPVVEEITEVLERDVNGDVPAQQLAQYGLEHRPDWKATLEAAGNARVHIFPEELLPDSYDADVVVTPAATGIEPGASIELVNHTQFGVDVDVAVTPEDVWWEDASFIDTETLDCDEAGMYKFRLTVKGEQHNVIVVCYDDVYTTRRSYKVENWVGDEPGFAVDRAKYIKQTIDRAWINQDGVVEPIYGADTVHPNTPLIVTEGVTDAIAAHQYGLPCVAPATTNFKQHHYDEICRLAEQVSTVFVVNDNEVNNAGINGALRTAKVIENDGHTVRVAELPRPVEMDKIDLAEFLKQQAVTDGADPRKELVRVLQNGTKPDAHELFDPERHDPAYRAQTGAGDAGSWEPSGDGSTFSDDIDTSEMSALYSLTLDDVINFDALSTGQRSGRTIYRGENPIQHHGNSTGYFVIRDHGEFITAKDYKIESSGDGYYYNALTWLACEATCECDVSDPCDCTRTVTRPMGAIADSEIWWAWRHAKTASHIPFPEDDRVPLRAMWFLADYHDVLPSQYIPDSFDDDTQLPPSKYNEVLAIIEDQYGIDPGREPLDTNED